MYKINVLKHVITDSDYKIIKYVLFCPTGMFVINTIVVLAKFYNLFKNVLILQIKLS